MYDFQFDFLSQDQNMILSESINYLFGDEMSRLRNENKALADRLRSAEKNSAFLAERNEKLSDQAQEACKYADKLKDELRAVRLELMDSHRANVTLRESLEKEREQAAHLSTPRPADADAKELRFQNEIMSKVIEKLKEELRASDVRVERSREIAEVKAKYRKLALEANNELSTYRDFAKRILRVANTAPKEALEDEKA